MNLAHMLATKVKELDLSPTAAAEKADVAYPPFNAVMQGKSLPNSRTWAKYAKFLGVPEADIEKLVVATKSAGPKAGKRRGRPPGSGRPKLTGKSGGLVGMLQAAVKAAGEAEAVLGDDLAMRVHRLPVAQRRTVEVIVNLR